MRLAEVTITCPNISELYRVPYTYVKSKSVWHVMKHKHHIYIYIAQKGWEQNMNKHNNFIQFPFFQNFWTLQGYSDDLQITIQRPKFSCPIRSHFTHAGKSLTEGNFQLRQELVHALDPTSFFGGRRIMKHCLRFGLVCIYIYIRIPYNNIMILVVTGILEGLGRS